MSRIPDIDAYLDSTESKELIEIGRQKERERILTIIKLDLMTTNEIKERLEALVYGGSIHVPEPRSSENPSGAE